MNYYGKYFTFSYYNKVAHIVALMLEQEYGIEEEKYDLFQLVGRSPGSVWKIRQAYPCILHFPSLSFYEKVN